MHGSTDKKGASRVDNTVDVHILAQILSGAHDQPFLVVSCAPHILGSARTHAAPVEINAESDALLG